jgi:hypothetical protein
MLSERLRRRMHGEFAMPARISRSLPTTPARALPGEPSAPRTAAKNVTGRHIFQRPGTMPPVRATVTPAAPGGPRRAASATALARSSAGRASLAGPPSEPGNAEPASHGASSPGRSHPASTSIDAPNQRLQAAQADVSQGDSVQHAAHSHGIGDADAMAALDRLATLGPGLNAVRAGMPVGRVVVSLDISDPAHIQALTNVAVLRDSGDPRLNEAAQHATLSHADECSALERLVAHGPALKAVREGQPIYAVIEQMGISSPMLRGDLHQVAALLRSNDRALRAHAKHITLQPLTDPRARTNLADLERLVTHGPAMAAVRAGKPVADVIAQMGISQLAHAKSLRNVAALTAFCNGPSQHATKAQIDTQIRQIAPRLSKDAPVAMREIEDLVTATAALAAVKAGHNPLAVAREMGIRSRDNINLLKNIAALAARPEPSERDFAMHLTRTQVAHPGVAATIERRTAAGPGAAAVRAGESVRAVAKRMGITSPGSLRRLEDAARKTSSPPTLDAPRVGTDGTSPPG